MWEWHGASVEGDVRTNLIWPPNNNLKIELSELVLSSYCPPVMICKSKTFEYWNTDNVGLDNNGVRVEPSPNKGQQLTRNDEY